MTLRARLLSLTLSMIAIVAVTLFALSLNNLTVTLLDVAISNAEMAGRQIQSFLLRRLPETLESAHLRPATLAETRDFWNSAILNDADLAALLEQTMAQSRSIVEIDVANDDGIIIASSNPQSRGSVMMARQDLRALRNAGPVGRIGAILIPRNDYERRVSLGIGGRPVNIDGKKAALFTIQILVSPILLRDITVPALRDSVVSGLALAAAFFVAYWSANLVLRPLTRIGHIIDDIVSGHELPPRTRAEDARELALIESKLSLLGERYRGAQEDATQLRSTLEGALEKLDLGTRRQLESQIALARRLTAINSLTGGVAHEIKNPLNSIALRLEVLRARVAGETTDDVDEQFAVLSSEVTRLDRVVRTFLDFSRPVDLNPERVDLAELVADVLLFIEPDAARHGIRTRFIRPAAPVCIEAGRDLLRQALLNIAGNAVEAMENGGGDLTIHIECNEESCAIVIADTGPGIPPDQREKIFQLYYTTRPRGTGIGLAMAFRAAQLHGGTIEVNSEMGKGTEFRVLLPLAGSPGAV